MRSDQVKKIIRKANKQPSNAHFPAQILCNALSTSDGELLKLECFWATHLTDKQSSWVFDLFKRNMQKMYAKSQWGYDEHGKLQELRATTARYIILSRDVESTPIAYVHYRFTEDNNRAVLYCYEIQVEREYQNKGVGSVLIGLLEQIAQKAQMERIMATVFAFNPSSLAFFHKNGFEADVTCPSLKEYKAEDQLDYLIISKMTL